MKELFEPPVVTVIDMGMSGTILTGSMQGNVETEGQDYEELDYSSESWS